MKSRVLAAIILSLGLAQALYAQNWPAFRGANASGNGDGQNPPTKWDATTNTNIVWKTPIPGLGHGSPIVWGNKVFIVTAINATTEDNIRKGNQYLIPFTGGRDQDLDMSKHYWKVIGIAGVLAALAVLPGVGQAQLSLPGLPPLPNPIGPGPTQTLTGQASGLTAVVIGNVTSLADTGTLSGVSEPLGTGLGTASIPGLVSAETLHSVTMGWSDQVVSEASLANLNMTVAGIGISADTILSRALAVSGARASGLTSIEGLSINGVPVSPTGIANQRISLPGLTVILNEQLQSASGIVVNALHVKTFDGLVDVVIGSAKAGI